MKIKTLKEYAAKFKWEFHPDDSPASSGGIVWFKNGFLRQRGEGFIVGQLYYLEVSLTDLLNLEEIGALNRLEFSAYLVPAVGKLNARFTLTNQDETLISAIRKLLQWCEVPNKASGSAKAVPFKNPHQVASHYLPMKRGESVSAYARRSSMTEEAVLKVLAEIPADLNSEHSDAA